VLLKIGECIKWKNMKINRIRSILYYIAKMLGDVQSGSKAVSKGSVKPILKRIGRRFYGKFASRGFNIFK